MERTFMARGFPDMTVIDIGHKARDWASWRLKFEVIFLSAAASIAVSLISMETFLATGITACLVNGGALEHAQEMAAHESPRTTTLHDCTRERLTQGPNP
jgi:hypothetical protein